MRDHLCYLLFMLVCCEINLLTYLHESRNMLDGQWKKYMSWLQRFITSHKRSFLSTQTALKFSELATHQFAHDSVLEHKAWRFEFRQ
jgi:hypothetical protein